MAEDRAPCPICDVLDCPGGPGHRADDLTRIQFEEWADPRDRRPPRPRPEGRPMTRVNPGHKDYQADQAEPAPEFPPATTPAQGPEEAAEAAPEDQAAAGPAEDQEKTPTSSKTRRTSSKKTTSSKTRSSASKKGSTGPASSG